jgi:Na+/phosphate symporter
MHDFTAHKPSLALQELERTQAALDAEIKSFEAGIAHPGYSKEKKDRWRLDLEDGRSLLRVTDKIVWELEKMSDAAASQTRALDQEDRARLAQADQSVAAKPAAAARGDGAAASKPSDGGSLEIGKS